MLPAGKPFYSHFISIGDSWSDNGNAFQLTHSTWPASPPNNEGRFSNGLIWTEIVSLFAADADKRLNVAFGSATVDQRIVQGWDDEMKVKIPGFLQQLEIMEERMKEMGWAGVGNRKDWLVSVWGGLNDYFFDPSSEPERVADSLLNVVSTLYDKHGIRNFLLPTFPDLGLFPALSMKTHYNSSRDAEAVSLLSRTPAEASALSSRQETRFSDGLVNFLKTHPDVRILRPDFRRILSDTVAGRTPTFPNPLPGSLWDYDQPPLDGIFPGVPATGRPVTDEETIARYVFSDQYHYSAAMHAEFAVEAMAMVSGVELS